jgi:hypothetical protein
MPVPQLVPSTWLSDSVHTAAPVVHTILPTRHGFPLTGQLIPAAHATQAPSLQTDPSAQVVPFPLFAWVSVHESTPLAEQAV